MLEFFCVFSKGGIVKGLWCPQGDIVLVTKSVNCLVREVLLQGKFGTYKYNSLVLQYKQDNNLDLIYLVAYQDITIHLSYIEKLFHDVSLVFGENQENEHYDFSNSFENIFKNAEIWAKCQERGPKQMKNFVSSPKYQKTAAALSKEKNSYLEKRTKTVKTELLKKPQAQNVKIPRVWDFSGDMKNLHKLDYSTDITAEEMDVRFTDFKSKCVQELISDEKRCEAADSTNGEKRLTTIFKQFTGSKTLSSENMASVLEILRDHLISKNVAVSIANKLCHSVKINLEGKVLNTFETVKKTVKKSLEDTLTQILTPKQINILQDCLHAKEEGHPYVIAFCGVNGVGKTTTISKVCYWLMKNNLSVLIAAGDKFRAGAVEQLRTHVKHLKFLLPNRSKDMVDLYEKGYCGDSASIVGQAIQYAVSSQINVVLIDTAGRMQENKAHMCNLAKIINMADPDLVLFISDALVGNSAVDQIVKFQETLLGVKSKMQIAITVTKLDTVDDKVGSILSLTQTTGLPILFLGTGQTYKDLILFDAKKVVHMLLT